MKVRIFKKKIRIDIGKFDARIELNPYEISIGINYGYQRYDSVWFGIKLPFLLLEFAFDFFDYDDMYCEDCKCFEEAGY